MPLGANCYYPLGTKLKAKAIQLVWSLWFNLVGVSNRRLVNLCLRVWPGWCARKTQGFILVWAECPYVQFEAARVTGTCL